MNYQSRLFVQSNALLFSLSYMTFRFETRGEAGVGHRSLSKVEKYGKRASVKHHTSKIRCPLIDNEMAKQVHFTIDLIQILNCPAEPRVNISI